MSVNNRFIQTVCGKKCIVKGEGKPLVFLHGFMSSKEAFLWQIDYFSRYYRVFAPDLTGFNGIEMPYPYRLDDYVAELKTLIENIGGKADLVAHSFGCRIALKAAATNDLIDKMVLCGVAGLKPRFSLKRAIRRKAYKALRGIIGKEKAEKRFCSADYLMTSGNLRESFKLVTSEYCDDYLSAIKLPTLCVFGEKDRETPPYLLKKLKKAGFEGVIMKSCGHFCFTEKPAEFNAVVAEFLL